MRKILTLGGIALLCSSLLTASSIFVTDGVPITLSLLISSGAIATETVTPPRTAQNQFDTYYAFLDSSNDIFGLLVIQAVDLSAGLPSGFAIDDLQAATPEPESAALLATGSLLLVFSLLRKRK